MVIEATKVVRVGSASVEEAREAQRLAAAQEVDGVESDVLAGFVVRASGYWREGRHSARLLAPPGRLHPSHTARGLALKPWYPPQQ